MRSFGRQFGLACPASVFAPARKAKPATKVDQQTFDFCETKSGGFVEINDCLPTAQVAFLTMDSVVKEFGPKAQPLLDKCLELNDKDAVGAATCSVEAIEEAVDLKSRLPDGAHLDDELFQVIANEDKLEAVETAQSNAQKLFPDVTLWGGNIYHAYKQ